MNGDHSARPSAGPYLTQGLHRAVQQNPDAIMTVCGERVRTFRQVADRVAALAGALRGLGVRSGDRVAILSLNSDRHAESMLAAAWADAVFVPLNTRWSIDEVTYALNDSAPRVLIVDDSFVDSVPDLRAGSGGPQSIIYSGEHHAPEHTHDYESLLAASAPVDDARRGGEQLACIFYTGGTTGFPKGVMLSHTNLMVSGLGSGTTLRLSGGRYLHVAPLFHLAGIVPWVVQMVVGGAHVMLPAFEVATVLSNIERHAITGITLVPAMIQRIVNDPATADVDLSSVESILYGASPISQTLLNQAIETFPSAGFTQAYGMTELAGTASFLTAEDHTSAARLRSAGRSCPHTELTIIGDDGQVLPANAVGEIAVRGGNVMQGYWNRPQETAATLRCGWMHTGDAGYLDEDGYLYVVDRLKDMIISGGENIYSSEVENAIESHPGVVECAVIGLEDEKWGERVHAVVVARAGIQVTPEELRDHVKKSIAGYKAPRSVEFVNALPRTNTGKVLKRDLRAK